MLRKQNINEYNLSIIHFDVALDDDYETLIRVRKSFEEVMSEVDSVKKSYFNGNLCKNCNDNRCFILIEEVDKLFIDNYIGPML